MRLLKIVNENFKKQGGIELVKQFKSAGVLLYSIMLFPFLCFSKTDLEIFRNAVSERVHQKLIKKYKNRNINANFSPDNFLKKHKIHSKKKIIWFLWLQGIDKAPELVKNNFKILNSVAGAERVMLVTEKNIENYITIPSFIISKWKNNIISNTHLSDIIRLELLVRYGGIWFDSTVMLTSNQLPQYIEDADFFVPQILKPGRDGKAVFISNWLIASKSENEITYRLLNLLYLYWSENDKLSDYFIFHHLLEVVFLEQPNRYSEMIPIDNSQSHSILISVTRDNLNLEDLIAQMKLAEYQKLSNKVTKDQNQKLLNIQKIRLREMKNDQ